MVYVVMACIVMGAHTCAVTHIVIAMALYSYCLRYGKLVMAYIVMAYVVPAYMIMGAHTCAVTCIVSAVLTGNLD